VLYRFKYRGVIAQTVAFAVIVTDHYEYIYNCMRK